MDTRKQTAWTGSMETLEERLAMSADPLGGLLGSIEHHAIDETLPPLELHAPAEQPPAIEHHLDSDSNPAADFWIDYSNLEAIERELGQIEQSLANAHDQTGMSQVRTNYGFDGTGQTVAVIDSGIAYDHFALGGGLGANYRVVGGWDFTGENDADPYDDGTAGSHGTHVSGIIGASGGAHEGVAPGVDLVGLRVFDDSGAGYFSWVENALQWVHDNRDSFENPITAINLSLGVASWNADSIPQWANLEDEFSQLEQDGIFIAVSAGNSYTSFNTTGLSYPAASPHVIPVASVDDNGLLSYFSQRNSRVIAAPGRGIISTVPDYAGNGNGLGDDYASFSGTSMASPYVAGASVIVREAMEFVGYTGITQDTIYDHMIATADSFFDSATNATYQRLNLATAIDALMPTDLYGSTVDTAYELGRLESSSALDSNMVLSGTIATLDDADYFHFTAADTGTVTFTATAMTHHLGASWQVSGGTGVWGGEHNEQLTLAVTAGQSYTVGFTSSDGLGYYDLEITAESDFSYTDWGNVSFTELHDVSISGEGWYRIVAASDGFLTTEALFAAGGNQINLELYDAQLQLVDSGTAVDGQSRVDVYATAGEEFFVKAIGTQSEVDFRLTNLVSIDGTTVHVAGTAGDDAFSFTAGSTHQVVVNGASYAFSAIAISDVQFTGGSGTDSISITGTSADETATLHFGQVELTSSGFTVAATDIENSILNSGGGNDTAVFYDSAAKDTLVTTPTAATFSNTEHSNAVNGFSSTYAYSTAGNDHAEMHDSAGNDDYRAYHNRSILKGSGFYNLAHNFSTTRAISSAGYDVARLYDSSGDETYDAYSDHVILTGSNFSNRADNFDLTLAYATSGHDIANLHDTAGYDTFRAYSDKVTMSGSGYYNYARKFDQNFAYSSGGSDFAKFYDSSGNDAFHGYSDRATMSGTSFLNTAHNFSRTQAYSFTGIDIAYFHDSTGDDTYKGYSNRANFTGSSFNHDARYFEQAFAYSSSGNDIAAFYDSAGNDTYESFHDRAKLTGAGFAHEASNFGRTYAYSTSGSDTAIFHDSAGDDNFYAHSDHAQLSGDGFYNRANNFASNLAYSTAGNDTARFYDTIGDDTYIAYPDHTSMSGTGYYNFASGFGATYAYATTGNDTATFYDSAGDDTYRAYHDKSMMSGAGFYNYARRFDQTYATSSEGNDLAKFYDSLGDDFLQAASAQASLTGSDFYNQVNDFAHVQAYSLNGGNDSTDISATDFALDQVGNWT